MICFGMQMKKLPAGRTGKIVTYEIANISFRQFLKRCSPISRTFILQNTFENLMLAYCNLTLKFSLRHNRYHIRQVIQFSQLIFHSIGVILVVGVSFGSTPVQWKAFSHGLVSNANMSIGDVESPLFNIVEAVVRVNAWSLYVTVQIH